MRNTRPFLIYFGLYVSHRMNEGKTAGGATWHGIEGTTFSGDVMPSFTRFLMATEGMYAV